MLKFKKQFNNVSSLIKSYEFIYYACIFMYVVIVIMLLGFGLYFHNNPVAVLDTSTIDGLTLGISVIKESFPPVSLEENIKAVVEETPSLPNRSLLQ